jgi:hypothetical protein
MRWLDANPLGDWIALGIVLFGLVCLSVSDWSRNRPRTPRS